MNSNAKFVFATAIAVILVAGALTLPLAFDDNMADAKKKSYKKSSSSKKSTKKAEIEAVGGHGGSAGAGGVSTGGNGGSATGDNGGSSSYNIPTETSRLISCGENAELWTEI